VQDGLTQPSHRFHASSDADRKELFFWRPGGPKKRLRARVLLLIEVLGPKTNFLLRLGEASSALRTQSHRMNDARKAALTPVGASRLFCLTRQHSETPRPYCNACIDLIL
jgi:hypothetical protein